MIGLDGIRKRDAACFISADQRAPIEWRDRRALLAYVDVLTMRLAEAQERIAREGRHARRVQILQLETQLATAEQERDKALVKADTLQFLVNQREIDIHALRELLREARPFVYAVEREDTLRDRIDATLERT